MPATPLTSDAPIRLGLIGAGGIVTSRHLPNLAKLPGVSLVAVANRSLDSGRAVAQKWNIPHVDKDWTAVIRREDVDAVLIGTWPYMHAEMSIASLAAGKHVFCQSRMAMNLGEARAMLDAATTHRHLVSMLCPPPHRMPLENVIRDWLHTGEAGDIAAITVTSVNDASLQSPTLHWRENVAYSGQQIMAMGIYAETLNAWFGPYEHLSAQFGQVIHHKADEHGREVAVRIPQTVAIHGRLRGASQTVVSELHCGAAAGASGGGDWLHVYGTQASLRYRFMSSQIEVSRKGQAWSPLPLPEGQPTTVDAAWHAERDFIDAVRKARAGVPAADRAVSPDFHEGLGYMAKIDAVHRSATEGRVIAVPQ